MKQIRPIRDLYAETRLILRVFAHGCAFWQESWIAARELEYEQVATRGQVAAVVVFWAWSGRSPRHATRTQGCSSPR